MDTKKAYDAHAAKIEIALQGIESQSVPQQVTDAITEIRGYLAEINAHDEDIVWWHKHGDACSQILIVGSEAGITPLGKIAEAALHGIQKRAGQY